ncbi:sensor histidine kinase [Dyadobacter fanqingshengii]|uniref:histidine kinase n=1 Tax=Dyadobacter fanqingshengii TaxID=2906443 RepID=A0A9X1PBM0_9BACT|nr:7TM diverse intracellular signaling domain-containing protein [Dyadobacter fanqingshengii]MCF0040287.1 ATP-binding protein [Dyadobacter fanqingshengii]USJ37965.1 ATP-binding protein [Dyadobacter fanqingshengii]
MSLLKHIFTILFLLSAQLVYGIPVNFYQGSQMIGKHVEIFEDATNTRSFEQVVQEKNFVQSTDDTPNMGLSQSTFWIRFSIANKSASSLLYLELAHPLIHTCELFEITGNKISTEKYLENADFGDRNIKHQNLVFNLDIRPGQQKNYYLKVKGFNQVILPLIIRDQENFFEAAQIGETINGIFSGIIIVMVLYNIFIYFSTRDKSYLFYVLYVLSVGLAQTALTGYGFKYLWPYAPQFNSIATIYFSGFAGIFAMLFVKNFLQLKEKWPPGVIILNVIIVLYSSTGLLNLLGFELLSFRAVDVSGGIGAIGLFIIGFKLSKEDYRPAKLFLIAWTIFLFGLFLLVLRNINILPYNFLTTYTMQFGSIAEVVLLSIALADKINIFKKEREESQAEALKVSLENEKIIMEQNTFLEKSVNERTAELQYANTELNVTLTKLKDTQTQLLDSEKMASLGQLTAGIAHEINNPINFVSSNIRPLRRDIDDVLEILDSYDGIQDVDSIDGLQVKIREIEKLKEDLDLDYIKTELGTLLKGMEDGASRTVEIVKGLKIFSRVDESDLNVVNINDGIESTLIILNYQMGNSITLVKELGNIPSIECFAGKLNQVFMNILNNSIYALLKQKNDNKTPTIWVRSWLKDPENIAISIRDNGPGMPPEVRAKIFEPFFTTKQVGDGTGLGLSIVFKIIAVHSGNIQVNTEVGQGTEFLITLPVKQKARPIQEFNE